MLSKWFGVMGGVGTTTSFLPQVFKSLRSSSLDGISPLMLVIHFSGVSSWMVYGYLRNDPILVATNSIAAVLVGTIGVRYLFVYLKGKRLPLPENNNIP